MKTSSLSICQPEYWQPASTQRECEMPEPARENEASPLRHASEIQRMKNFAGQRRFQAPVADDFARGMLAPGQTPVDETRTPVEVRGTLASVILGLRSLCIGQRAHALPVSDALKHD